MTEVHSVVSIFGSALRGSTSLMEKLNGGAWYVHIPDAIDYPVLRYWVVSSTPADVWVGQYGEGVIAVDIYSESLGGDSDICGLVDGILHRKRLTSGSIVLWVRRDEGWKHDYEPDERGGRGLWTTSAQFVYEVVSQ